MHRSKKNTSDVFQNVPRTGTGVLQFVKTERYPDQPNLVTATHDNNFWANFERVEPEQL